MFECLTKHEFWMAVAASWALSAGVSSLPEPNPQSATGYIWFHRFANTVAGNLATAFAGKLSNGKGAK